MPDFIEKNIEVFNGIVDVFENDVKDDLDHEAKELTKRLKRVLEKHAKTYRLEAENDVNPIKYYSLKHRIKGVESLREKLVRKNDGFKITQATGVSDLGQIEARKAFIISELRKVPDIIGVRIVTELRVDCIKVLDLIRAFVDDFAALEIVLDKVDLEAQPQPMKNGLSIFKVKGVFRAAYGFELQIKSKIEEAWGDMDHAIFYKDYSVTPIKNVTQVTMNNIGKLLENIDHLLLGLRNSNTEYQENLEQLAKLKSLNDELFPLIERKLGIGFEIGKIASFLAIVKEKASNADGITAVLTDIDCSFFDYPVVENRLIQYLAIRKGSFELMIIELAYFNWCMGNGKFVITPENYQEKLSAFLDILADHIFRVIESENSAQAAELNDSQNLSNKITLYSKYINNQEIYLSEKTLIHISKIEGVIEEFFQEKQDIYFSEDVDYTDFKTAFKVVYVIESLGYDNNPAIDDLLHFNNPATPINVQLDIIAYDFKEYQRKNERNTRADQKKGEVVKQSHPTVGITESVINNLKLKLDGE